MFVATLVQTLSVHQHWDIALRVGMRIRTSIVAAIYGKVCVCVRACVRVCVCVHVCDPVFEATLHYSPMRTLLSGPKNKRLEGVCVPFLCCDYCCCYCSLLLPFLSFLFSFSNAIIN